MAISDNELVSTREAARMLGVALRTAQLWVESGMLRAWKTAGGHRRILRSSVEEMLARRQQELAGGPRKSKKEGFQILVVEDEPDLLKLYLLTMEGWGLPLRVVTASNGFDGLVRIGETHPDLLITDLNMPGMDGFRMIRNLVANASFRNLDIVAVTALGKDEIADRGGLPSGVRVFTKPVPFSEIEKIVREKLGAAKPAR